MVARLSKNRKMRGHVSSGHGRVGKHRKHPGGRGKAGGLLHHRNLWDRYHPGYFGKVGMRHFHQKKNAIWMPTINIDQINALLTDEQKASKDVPDIDLNKHGFFKILGRGELARAMVIKARMCSDKAEARIKSAGGNVILTA